MQNKIMSFHRPIHKQIFNFHLAVSDYHNNKFPYVNNYTNVSYLVGHKYISIILFQCIVSNLSLRIFWHIDHLLGNDVETNNETTVIAMEHLHTYATKLRPACSNGTTVESGVFYVSALRLYHSTNRVEFS
jgi:hypothetical protein